MNIILLLNFHLLSLSITPIFYIIHFFYLWNKNKNKNNVPLNFI